MLPDELDTLMGLGDDAMATGLNLDDQRTLGQLAVNAAHEIRRLRAERQPAQPDDDGPVDLDRALRAYGDRYLDQWDAFTWESEHGRVWALISRQPIDALPDEVWVELPQPDDALTRLRARIDGDTESRATVDALKREMRDEQGEAAMRAAGYRRCGCCGYEGPVTYVNRCAPCKENCDQPYDPSLYPQHGPAWEAELKERGR